MTLKWMSNSVRLVTLGPQEKYVWKKDFVEEF